MPRGQAGLAAGRNATNGWVRTKPRTAASSRRSPQPRIVVIIQRPGGVRQHEHPLPAGRPGPRLASAARPGHWAAPFPVLPAPRCRARRSWRRSTCARTKRARRPGASTPAAGRPVRWRPAWHFGSRRQRARRAPPGRRPVIEPDQAVKGDGPVGEGAGLVQAHHVHPGQPLHGGKLLNQHPAPGEGDRGRAEGDAGRAGPAPAAPCRPARRRSR